MTGSTALVASSTTKVNGPEDDLGNWAAVDWRAHEDNVRRLRQRIFKASKDGDLRQVRRLQKLMLRSWSNTLLSVRLVTQRNAGRRTAGVDGEVALSPRQRMDANQSCGGGGPEPIQRQYAPSESEPVVSRGGNATGSPRRPTARKG